MTENPKKSVESFELLNQIIDPKISETKYLMKEEEQEEIKEPESDAEYTKTEIEALKTEIEKLKGRVPKDTRWMSTRPVNKISTMQVPAALKDDLFDERLEGESQADIVRRILDEVREYREIEYQIVKVLISEETDEKKVESIKNMLVIDEEAEDLSKGEK